MLNPPYQVGTLPLARKLKSHEVPARLIRGKFPPSLCLNCTSQLSRLKGPEKPAPAQRGPVQSRATMGVLIFLGHLPDNKTCEHRARTIPTVEKLCWSQEKSILREEAACISKLQSCRKRVAGKKHWPSLQFARSPCQLLQPPCPTLVGFMVNVAD